MSRSSHGTAVVDAELPRTEQIQRAADRLGGVLQSLDLEEDARLADELITAIRAVDRAYDLETTVRDADRKTGRDRDREADGFRFPSSLADERLPRNR
ncbi:hypothetical protein [Halopenitus sp. POP-27]|uniref:hypothetical protein n=1 Tax=Halopenitus sp. POP-27 TaxID=2994425 RepID=UPI002468B207|nr:hypothetical protein [Halopenitus sp. POP-27]